jgi:hypothetical protein
MDTSTVGRAWLLGFAGAIVLGIAATPAFAQTEAAVSTGSPPSPFSQNKQNEPALAVDPSHPSVLVSGSNDNIDMEACAAGDPTTCPFTPGVGASGIYFSFDSGHNWSQPTYTGWTARDCLGPAACTPQVGPIGTVPWYHENGLASDGDPAIAFGPRPGANGSFSWANGSRLYYGNLASNFSSVRSETAFSGYEAVAVSRSDDVVAAASSNQNAWMPPVIVSKQNGALFSDKSQIWADNASSSAFFGRVYMCYAAFRSNSHGPASAQPLVAAVSGDGGSTWTPHQVTAATNNPSNALGHSACTVRTDSRGDAYVFYYQFASGSPGYGSIDYVRSSDGGATWSRPQVVTTAVDSCNYVDPVVGRCMMDGVAGSRSDLSPAPSVDIANGAPSGSGASNEILLTWVDGRAGLNHEKVMLTDSTDGGRTWATATDVTRAGDRGYYSATAISPHGDSAYLTYLAWETPFQTDTSNPRILQNVVLSSPLDTSGAPAGWTEIGRSAPGDARGSSQNNLAGEFLGDYVSAIATPTYGAAVWTDVRNAADCPAIDAWRQSKEMGGSVPRPSPNSDCPPNFGNTDIYGLTTAP